jgi:methylenetetrahydrofolate dehydrogenase (NADP+)/methenyltetrahydrofolate cyclohydrolase
MAVLDGKALAKEVRRGAAELTERFVPRAGRKPALRVVMVGEHPASKVYVRNKRRAAKKVGLDYEEHHLPEQASQRELLDLVESLNGDDGVDGFIVQLPLPEGLDPQPVLLAIDPDKDVDGFHPVNLGRLVAGAPGLAPCTPVGCLKLIDEAGVELEGTEAVVVGRSEIVGKPMAHLLLQRHATVTICHSRTRELDQVVGRADVLVVAVGKAGLVRGDWVKPGSCVIDVGTNRGEDGKLVGDVEFEAAAERAAWITPVPGGVGPMTVACLIENTVRAAFARAGIEI